MPQTQGSRCAMPEGHEGEDPVQAALAESEEPPDPRGPEAVRSRVRRSIAESGLAQREFARRLGLDETKLSKALRGTRRFSPTEVAQIADIADVTVTWLLSGADPASPRAEVAGTNRPVPPLLGTTQTEHVAEPDPANHLVQPSPGPAIRFVQPSPAGAVPRPRQAIVEAATRLFAARGRHAVRISEIAAACGVSTSAFYHYFTGKDALFEEVLRYIEARAEHDQAAVLEHADGPVQRLRELVALRLPTEGDRADEWSLRVQGWALSVAGAGSFMPRTGVYERWHGAVLAVLREGQAVDVIVPGPAEDLALQLTGLIDGLGTKVLTGMITVEDMGRVLEGAIDQLLVPPGSDPAAPHPEHFRRSGGEHR